VEGGEEFDPLDALVAPDGQILMMSNLTNRLPSEATSAIPPRQKHRANLHQSGLVGSSATGT